MKCKNCGFDNLMVEFIKLEDLDEDEELDCECCQIDLREQLKSLGNE